MPASAHQEPSRIVDRRSFLSVAAAVSVPIALPGPARAALRALSGPVRIGVIADLHHDIMHDGPERLGGFIEAMKGLQPDALLQLGDFAYPSEGNREVIDLFNGAHERAYHVIGNHDLDAGRTRDDCLGIWGMPARHYTASFGGVQLVVLIQPGYAGVEHLPNELAHAKHARVRERRATVPSHRRRLEEGTQRLR